MTEYEIDFEVIIIGGGASGFFTAINLALERPGYRIAILEKSNEVLNKVRISGGGRCNVTHAEFIPNELAKNYPRGKKELKGPFHNFCTGDTIDFFETRGVKLKIEEDGRIFPVSDSSQTIINCFLTEAEKLGVQIFKSCAVTDIQEEQNKWHIKTTKKNFISDYLVVCSGSSPKMWKLIKKLGHTIVPPVPSLFTFNCKDSRIEGLAGISTNAGVKIHEREKGKKELFKASGPLLITHWGFSGPAILKLSAWAARALAQFDYSFSIEINWLPQLHATDCKIILEEARVSHSKKTVQNFRPFDIPKRLWLSALHFCHISFDKQWASLSNKDLNNLAGELTSATYFIKGKSTYKDEFVTAGGVELKEIDFRTYQSKILPGCYFAGEVLNIDAVTGGFNFQNAWTGAYMVAKAIAANT